MNDRCLTCGVIGKHLCAYRATIRETASEPGLYFVVVNGETKLVASDRSLAKEAAEQYESKLRK